MLSDRDRRILADLERQFEPAGPGVQFPTIAVLCVLLFLTVPLVTLLFGWPGLLITLDVFAVAVAFVLIRRRRARRRP
jgi:Flp pilus assembly protein TadB